MDKCNTLLGLSELLDQSQGLAGDAALHPSAGSGIDNLQELLLGEVQKSLHLESSVGELLELSLLSESGDSLNVEICFVCHFCLLLCGSCLGH